MKAAGSSVLLSHETIQGRVAEMGRQISADYRGRALTVIGILKGSFIFVADLVRQIDPSIPVEVDFMSVSSYGDGTSSSGNIKLLKDVDVIIQDRDILLVEDIVDTGLTLTHVHGIVTARQAR